MRGEIYNETGEKDAALTAYKDYWRYAPNAQDIPDEYMKDVDAEAYDKIIKEREKKELEKAEKEKDKMGEKT